jgi:hypothetical protein
MHTYPRALIIACLFDLKLLVVLPDLQPRRAGEREARHGVSKGAETLCAAQCIQTEHIQLQNVTSRLLPN